MKRRRITVVAIVVGYFLSYLAMTVNGRYKSMSWRPVQGPNDTFLLQPRRGYDWHPFDLYYLRSGRPTVRHCIYFPLIWLDRLLWHKRGEAKSGRYEVQTVPDRLE